MLKHFQVGSLAIVIPGKGNNNVRVAPNGALVEDSPIPEQAVLALLPRPTNWNNAYPYALNEHVWWYIRGRTQEQVAPHCFRVIEGWIAANKGGDNFLALMDGIVVGMDTQGNALTTYLAAGQQAYVLPSDGLNARAAPDPHSARVGGLATGSIITATGKSVCSHNMVWWQVQPAGASKPLGWCSEGDAQEWFLIPLTLE